MTQAGWQDEVAAPQRTVPVAAANPNRPRRAGALANAAPYAVLVLAIAFLAFVAGSFLTFTGSFPANHLTDAFRGGLALLEKNTQYDTPYPSDFWQPARTEAKGVTIYDPGRAFNGFTLYTSGHAQKAFLVSMTGEVVHEWQLPFSTVWDEGAAVQDPQPDSLIYLEKAHLLPNGDLLALYVAIGTSPWGLGLVRLNQDSEVVWKYLQQAHHDFDVGEDGRIYALTHEIRTDKVEGHEHLAPPRIDDYVVVLSADGEELKKVWLLGALANSPYASMLSTVPWYIAEGKGDYLHTNSIDVIEGDPAARLPFAQAGQVLLSLREIGAIALLDLEREQVVWALRGPWLRQHDADLLADGHLLPNGDLLALYVAIGTSPWGLGLVRLNQDSEVVWKYLQQAHHDFDVGEDGRIYALTHEIRTDKVEGHEHLAPPRIDDYVVVLSADGEELKKVWLLGALANSPYASMLSTVPWYIAEGKGDYLHTNSIDVIEGDPAARLPFAAPGQVLLSLREIGAIALLDLEREQIVWALRGPWLRQHDADLLADGHLLLFDNEGAYGGKSRILGFDPTTLEITWSYAGDDEHPFYSRVRSAQERLPNGDTLITESDGGRLFEVTPEGEIVWEYLNPERGGDAGELIPIVSWGQRVDPAALDPGFREFLTQ